MNRSAALSIDVSNGPQPGNDPGNVSGNAGGNKGGAVRIETSVPGFVQALTVFTYVLITVMLGYVWLIRDEGHLTAESGLGYALGIAGVVATLGLLTYPLRKRLKIMRNWGSVATWFHFHMLLGIVAPALILAHSSFSLGSLNSSVALLSMLIVAASGVIGRYIYVRIHYGLYGARATLEELRSTINDEQSRVGVALTALPSLRNRLFAFAVEALAPTNNLLKAAGRSLFVGLWIRWVKLASIVPLSRELKQEAQRSGWSRAERRQQKTYARLFIANYLSSVRKTVQFTLYERLFALWHILHIPLFFMLLIATVVHIIAVHMY